MRRLLTRITLLAAAVASPVFAAAAAPATAPAPATHPRATRGQLEYRTVPTDVEIPRLGLLMLDERRATEKGAFLGVSVTQVTPELREQLKLRRGVGLVVNHVEAGSPAEAAL